MTELLASIAGLLREVTGEDEEWAGRIGPRTRLDGDLFLESVEFAALGVALSERYGAGVDLAGYLAGLSIDEIIELTVDDVAGYVAASRAGAER